jgi:cytochrome c556
MIMRLVLTVAALMTLTGTGFAQSNPVNERKEIMTNMAHAFYGTLNRMRRGQIPFDAKQADEGFATVINNAPKLPALFADSTKDVKPTGKAAESKYGPSPKLWENKADFDNRLRELVKVATENRAVALKDLEGLKSGVTAVRQVCDGCHEKYQIEHK